MAIKIIALGDTHPFPVLADAYRAGDSAWYETTEGRTDDAIGVVPPVYFEDREGLLLWAGRGRVGFFMGEPFTHDDRGVAVYTAFVCRKGRYFARNVARDQIALAVAELDVALMVEAAQRQAVLSADPGPGKVAACVGLTIVSVDHPEWGAWTLGRDRNGWTRSGRSGVAMLDESEFHLWTVERQAVAP